MKQRDFNKVKKLVDVALKGDPLDYSFNQGALETIRKALMIADRVMGEPDVNIWGGLPRDIVMARDMRCMKGHEVRKHLEMIERDIPHWLDAEMKQDKHVAKGDMVVWIFKTARDAMLKEVDDATK